MLHRGRREEGDDEEIPDRTSKYVTVNISKTKRRMKRWLLYHSLVLRVERCEGENEMMCAEAQDASSLSSKEKGTRSERAARALARLLWVAGISSLLPSTSTNLVLSILLRPDMSQLVKELFCRRLSN